MKLKLKIWLYRDMDGDLWLCREFLGKTYKCYVDMDDALFSEVKVGQRIDFKQV